MAQEVEKQTPPTFRIAAMIFSPPTSRHRAGVWIGAGVLLGIFLIATLAGLLYTVPRLLVIKAAPVSSEAAVVLGGGRGERLRETVDGVASG